LSGGGTGTPKTTYRVFDGSRILAEYAATDMQHPTRVLFYGENGLDDLAAVRVLVAGGIGGVGAGGAYTTPVGEYYPLQGSLNTVEGLADSGGKLFEWYEFDTYGMPVRVDDLATTAQQGKPCVYRVVEPPPTSGPNWVALPLPYASIPNLFTGQRLEVFDRAGFAPGADPDPLVVYDYKARAHDPRHGRFLQRDPMEFGDGYGLYEYVGGRPRSSSDPTGEFEFSILGILGGSATAQELQSDWGQEVGDVALTLRDVIENLHGDYVLDQAFDGDWAAFRGHCPACRYRNNQRLRQTNPQLTWDSWPESILSHTSSG